MSTLWDLLRGLFKHPVVAAYIDFGPILDANPLQELWPNALKNRILNNTASVIHIPFKKAPLQDAIGQFDINKRPFGLGKGVYDILTYRNWNLLM
jgi:hypothetical protein